MLQCSHCPKEFRYISERKRHELSHSPRFQCNTCRKKFSFVSALRRHQKQHERTESVKCEECNHKFLDEVLLKRHIKYAHKGTFTCEKCDSKFSSEIALRTHMKTHKPESERRFKCSYRGCSKSFNFSHHLKHHELTHTNDKQHHCSICGKGFIQSHHLKTHLRSHNPAVWLTCEAPGCQKKFTTDYARKRHIATHITKPDSGISSDSNSSKECCEESIFCARCGETFLQSVYKIHSSACLSDDRAFDISNIKTDSDVDNDKCSNTLFKPYASIDDLSIKSIVVGKTDKCKMMAADCTLREADPMNTQIPTYLPSNKNYNSFPNGKNNNDTIENCDVENSAQNLEHDDNNMEMVDLNSIIVNPLTDYSENKQKDMCDGCDCVNICNAKVSLYELTPAFPNLTPKIIKKDSESPSIEYRPDGVIKIVDTIDDDIIKVLKIKKTKTTEKVNYKSKKDTAKPQRFMPFSTCKDAIGNCLASSDDGCLCARMMAVEDQAILAQEIDNITPQPKTEPEVNYYCNHIHIPKVPIE